MEEDPREREIADKILEAIKREYGFIPVVNQVMQTRPDIFIAQSNLNKAVFEGKNELDDKTKYLCAVSDTGGGDDRMPCSHEPRPILCSQKIRGTIRYQHG